MRNLLIILIVISSGHLLCQSNSEISNRIDSLLLARYNLGFFNGSVLVVKDNQVIYKRSLGWSNVEKKDSLKLSDPMRIASITKMYTAVCVLQLCQEGKIDLAEDINTYLPEIEKSGITIHHLLSHTSGIAYINGLLHFRKVAKYSKKNGTHRMKNRDVLKYFKEHKPNVKALPGEENSYSNISFSILAILIERISKLSYQEYLKEKIFKPMKMENTFLYLPPNKYSDNPELVVSYKFKKGKMKRTPVYYKYNKKGVLKYSNDIYGDKYICSTVEDMSKFNFGLLNEQLLSKKYFEIMKTSIKLNNGSEPSDKYGCGLYQSHYKSSVFYGHGGHIASFISDNFFSLDGTQVIIFSNIETKLNPNESLRLQYSIFDILNDKNKLSFFSSNEQSDLKIKKHSLIFQEKYKINYLPFKD